MKRTGSRRWAAALVAAAGVAAGVLSASDSRATPATFTFVAPNPGWVVATNGGMPLSDPEGDTPGPRDIVGDAMNPMLYIASDATHLYFRLRLDEDPTQSPTNISPFGWGCFINTDSDLTTYEFSTIVDGVNNPDQIHFFKNTITSMPNDPTDPPDMPALETVNDPLAALVLHAKVEPAPSMFGGTPDFFLEWAVDLTSLVAGGFNPAKPASYYCGTSNSGTDLGADCSGSTSTGCPLDGDFSDPVGCGPLGCTICGDGMVDPGEGCDDGNLVNGDGCNSVCLKELGQMCMLPAQCASAFCDPAGNICACDDDGDCPGGQTCNTGPNPNVCANPGCGNGMLDEGEGCDDGNFNNGDGCNSACLKELGQMCMASLECASEFCDPAGNVCACDSDADCPAGQLCDTGPDPNQCVSSICGDGKIEGAEQCDDQNKSPGDGCSDTCTVEDGWTCMGEPSTCEPAPCGSDADCKYCNEQYSICVPGCTMPADCPTGFFCDLKSSICVPLCKDGSECPSGHCDAATGECVECTADADCPMGQKCGDGTCGGGCQQNPDCPSGLVCNVPLGICVECLADADCKGGLSCIDDRCLPGCNEEADCNGVMCNETVGVCVQCAQDSDCPMDKTCNEATGQCVDIGCEKDSDCPNGLVCDEPNHVCVKCTQDSECASGQVCDETTHTCVQCTQDSECPDGQKCDEAAHTCSECAQDSDCGSGKVCDEATSHCVQCTQDSECASGQVCETAVTHTCVECTGDAQCGESTCDQASHTCKKEGYVAEGAGIFCAAQPGGAGNDKLALALLGLLGLTFARRRRRG